MERAGTREQILEISIIEKKKISMLKLLMNI